MPVPDFSPGEVLTAAAMDSIGLWLVKTQTIGTGVSSVAVTDAFNASYDNYRIVVSGVDCSINENVFYLKLSGSTGSTYSSAIKWVAYPTGTLGGFQLNASSTGWVVGLSSILDNTAFVADIYNPFLAKGASFSTQSGQTAYMVYGGGYDSNAASSTGLTLVAPTSNTFTGGTIRVYGYRN